MDSYTEVERVLRLEGQAILDCARRWESEPHRSALQRALDHLQKALGNGGKIIVTGVGKSGKVGQKLAATLCSTGSLAVYLHPTEGLHGDLGVIAAQDVVVALSYTGNTDELVRLLPSLKALGVPVLSIGGNAQSRLAAGSDVWLDGSVEQEACPHGLAPTCSTTLALAIGDALAIALMKARGFDASSFARNHPGGSLGRKLHLKVEDVMHRDERLAKVGPTATMDQVVMQATEKRLGAVLVVDGPKLLGIITESDIRRALGYREKFFQLLARDAMTSKPVTIRFGALASEALELMENRPYQLSALPVVDDAGNWKGLVRIHDIVQAF